MNKPGGVIPVGREPPRQSQHDGENIKPPTGTSSDRTRLGKNATDLDRKGRNPIRNPDAFFTFKNRLDETRVFREETMRKLTRSEICVWLAIHGCQHDGAAQISNARIAELAGIGGRRHVVEAIKSLHGMGLLRVLVKGRYTPNGSNGYGLSSVYQVFPRAEPSVLEAAKREQKPRVDLDPRESGVANPGVPVDVAKTCSRTNQRRPTKPR